MKKSESFFGKVKVGSRKAFIGMGNMAVGNALNDNSKRKNMDVAPFSWTFFYIYETPMPKRKNK